MSEPVDLWGADFDFTGLVPPVTYLREQAAVLGKKTRYIIQAAVDTSHNGSQVVHTFTVIAPALDDYRYQLFRISHGINLYPVQVYWENKYLEASDEAVFQRLLGEILSSETTQRVVRSLLAQSKVSA